LEFLLQMGDVVLPYNQVLSWA